MYGILSGKLERERKIYNTYFSTAKWSSEVSLDAYGVERLDTLDVFVGLCVVVPAVSRLDKETTGGAESQARD